MLASPNKKKSIPKWVPSLIVALVAMAAFALFWWRFTAPPSDTGNESPTQAALNSPPKADDVNTLQAPQYDQTRALVVKDKAKELFLRAMQDYQQSDYAGASVRLRQATIEDPHAPEARFFLGACYLMTNDTRAGIAELKVVTSLDDSPYWVDANMLLARAYVQQKDWTGAVERLDLVDSRGGAKADEAAKLRAQIYGARDGAKTDTMPGLK
jgi:TolA-binding protein